MKKIGIDARLYSQTGVGTYISNLIYYLEKIAPKNILFYVYLLQQDMQKLKFSSKQFVKRVADYRWHSLSEQTGFAKKLLLDKLNLVHFTYFSYPILYKKRFISTIHDITPLIFKTGKASTKNSLIFQMKYFFFKIVLESQINGASAIITPSKTVYKQLVRLYADRVKDKTVAIYEGVDNKLFKIKENNKLKNRFRDKFFIYVGNFYPHKNVEALVSAFSRVDSGAKLILIGPKDFFASRLAELVSRLKQSKRIIFYHNPKKENLIFFYKKALALIHPSLSEGFGLPLLEACYFNLPVIASNIDVFREILGNNYIAFNPRSESDMVSKIQSFVEKKPKQNFAKVLKRYSFEEMAKKTLDLYHKNL